MNALLWSLILPFTGPTLALVWAGLSPASARAMRIVEPVALAATCAVILLNVVPGNIAALGAWSLAVTAVAFVVAFGAGRLAGSDEAAREVVQTAAVGGILVHALADGAALFSFGGSITLGPAIALDRLAIGFFIWSLLQPRYGARVCFSALALVAAATCGGYLLMAEVSRAVANPAVIGVFQSVLAGLVLALAADHRRLHRHGRASVLLSSRSA